MKWLADKNLQHIIRQWKGQGKKMVKQNRETVTGKSWGKAPNNNLIRCPDKLQEGSGLRNSAQFEEQEGKVKWKI